MLRYAIYVAELREYLTEILYLSFVLTKIRIRDPLHIASVYRSYNKSTREENKRIDLFSKGISGIKYREEEEEFPPLFSLFVRPAGIIAAGMNDPGYFFQ